MRYPQAVLARVQARQVLSDPGQARIEILEGSRRIPPATPPASPPPEDTPTRISTTPPPLDARELDVEPPPTEFQEPTQSPPPETQAPPEAFVPPSLAADPPRSQAPPRPSRLRAVARWGGWALISLLVLGSIGAVAGWRWAYTTYGTDLPDIVSLQTYQPHGVTRVLDRRDKVLGEIYEQRRYLLDWEDIPPLVRDAFIAAEDANFWTHDGLDYGGILRAALRNVFAGRWAQGGSTITQQVAKNFLVGNERALGRKAREAFVAWHIESTLSKERILYLYLNEIYLGSQAYGIEAAARTFFDKHVHDLTLAEAALIAGLPPRPSEWNPHANPDAAVRRQRYVLDRMVHLNMVTPDEAQQARRQELVFAPRRNLFRENAPWCTEAVRRQLVELFGDQPDLLQRGMTVFTTCDLDLQQQAQHAVTEGVHHVDHRRGLRRDGITTLPSSEAIQAHLDAQEARLLAATRSASDAPPAHSQLAQGQVADATLVEVQAGWARARIGRHEGIVPLAWTTWAYPPNPARNFKYRAQDDLTMPVDDDGDGKPDGGILRVGDVIPARIEALSTQHPKVSDAFKGTPGADNPDLLALRLWPEPEVEGALLSLDLESGAIRAMVGGVDFGRSQLNRTNQTYRQVGSTLKPLVYTAAISTERMTAASVVADAPLAFGSGDDLWKPGNYGGDYKGNLTLRQALALSRNTCTVRVMDAVDPGMRRGVVYQFLRDLGIGGPPTHLLGDAPPSPRNDHLCPWLPKEEAGWCGVPWTDPASGSVLCRACDLSIALGSTSLTMQELLRAYAVLGRGGQWVEPYLIERIVGPDGDLLYEHQPPAPTQVVDPDLADIAIWLLQQVVDRGTGVEARRELGVPLAGKTGTTNDEKDTWFVGMSPRVATAVWVGFDQPRSLGAGNTGGATALPIWIDYMRHVVSKARPEPFPEFGEVVWAPIDEATGRRSPGATMKYPFLPDTVPEAEVLTEGQASFDDLAMEL